MTLAVIGGILFFLGVLGALGFFAFAVRNMTSMEFFDYPEKGFKNHGTAMIAIAFSQVVTFVGFILFLVGVVLMIVGMFT